MWPCTACLQRSQVRERLLLACPLGCMHRWQCVFSVGAGLDRERFLARSRLQLAPESDISQE